MSETTLTRYDAMRHALMEAHSIDEVKDIRDKAEALRHYVRQAGESLESQNMIAEIKLRAERRAGELLRETPKAKPSGSNQHEDRSHGVTDPPKLEELGVTKMQSSRWQSIASIPDELFEAEIIEAKAKAMELTSAGMLRVAQEVRRENMRNQKQDAHAIPDDKYRVLYADPPWQYGNSGVITGNDNYGRAERHYPSMSIAELCEMGQEVKGILEPDAVLFMWVTSPLLEECFEVIRSWGFKYKSSFVWDKVRHNFAHYNSMRHEFLLVCTRGSCTPDIKTLYDSVVECERTRTHSEKPEMFREMIDTLYPHGKRLELFARRCVDGWETWGNE